MKYKYFFIGNIPILLPERNLARQLEVEFWLDATPFLNQLGLKTQEQIADEKRRGYVV